MTKYLEKYLKYKTKYLKLKNNYLGSAIPDITDDDITHYGKTEFIRCIKIIISNKLSLPRDNRKLQAEEIDEFCKSEVDTMEKSILPLNKEDIPDAGLEYNKMLLSEDNYFLIDFFTNFSNYMNKLRILYSTFLKGGNVFKLFYMRQNKNLRDLISKNSEMKGIIDSIGDVDLEFNIYNKSREDIIYSILYFLMHYVNNVDENLIKNNDSSIKDKEGSYYITALNMYGIAYDGAILKEQLPKKSLGLNFMAKYDDNKYSLIISIRKHIFCNRKDYFVSLLDLSFIFEMDINISYLQYIVLQPHYELLPTYNLKCSNELDMIYDLLYTLIFQGYDNINYDLQNDKKIIKKINRLIFLFILNGCRKYEDQIVDTCDYSKYDKYTMSLLLNEFILLKTYEQYLSFFNVYKYLLKKNDPDNFNYLDEQIQNIFFELTKDVKQELLNKSEKKLPKKYVPPQLRISKTNFFDIPNKQLPEKYVRPQLRKSKTNLVDISLQEYDKQTVSTKNNIIDLINQIDNLDDTSSLKTRLKDLRTYLYNYTTSNKNTLDNLNSLKLELNNQYKYISSRQDDFRKFKKIGVLHYKFNPTSIT